MRDDDDERTREDSATQPMDAGWLSFAILNFISTHYLSSQRASSCVKPNVSIEWHQILKNFINEVLLNYWLIHCGQDVQCIWKTNSCNAVTFY